MSLLDVKLVIGLVARVSSQLGSLSVGIILRLETNKTIWLG